MLYLRCIAFAILFCVESSVTMMALNYLSLSSDILNNQISQNYLYDMCTHQRIIYNRYIRDSFLVSCGKCPACLQEKAYRRASRIKTEYSPDKIVLFVTLTYDRWSCPFVRLSDIKSEPSVLPIYREFFTRRVRTSFPDGSWGYADKRVYHLTHIDDIEFPDYSCFKYRLSGQRWSKDYNIKTLNHRHRNVGICYFPDVQNFKKRLNINLKRKYNYYENYKVYATTEYGETTSRPHAHLLFHIRPCDAALFRAAIPEAWPFADKCRTAKYIEIAKDAANYVSTYVNSPVNVHPFLSINCKAKSSYSKDYGMSDKLYTLDSVLSRVSRNDLSYLRPVGRKGLEQYIRVSIPKYVINRYFPLFKGYSRFNSSEVLDVLRSFCRPNGVPTIPYQSLRMFHEIDYSNDDLRNIGVRLSNSYKRFCHLRGLPVSESTREDYIRSYKDTWQCFKNTNLRLWYLDEETPPKYKYYNSIRLKEGIYHSPETLHWMENSSGDWIRDPNKYPTTVNKTSIYEDVYRFRIKEKKQNNFVMAQNNPDYF